MRCPERMKKGIASKAKLLTPLAIFCASITEGSAPSASMATKLATAMATAKTRIRSSATAATAQLPASSPAGRRVSVSTRFSRVKRATKRPEMGSAR